MKGPCGKVCAEVLLVTCHRQVCPLSSPRGFLFSPSPEPVDGSPGPAGMGFYTCAVLLPFH